MPMQIVLTSPLTGAVTGSIRPDLQTGTVSPQNQTRQTATAMNTGWMAYSTLPLIARLLQQIGQQQGSTAGSAASSGSSGSTTTQTDSGSSSSGSATSSGSTPASSTPLTLTATETSLLTGIYGADSSGNSPAGQTLSVLDGSKPDQRLSEGDTLLLKNADGQETLRKTLTTTDLYDLRFRENMTRTASTLGSGWAFSEQLVHINGGELTQPTTGSDGQTATETVLERNNFWEVVQRGANRYLLMRQTDEAGNPVKAADAINDVFTNRQNYAFDCATPMRLLNLKATLDTIGPEDFNRQAGRLQLSSWYDQHDSSSFDGGFIAKSRTTTQAGVITVNGTSNLKGETALFDTSQGDSLRPGNAYYFDLPGDNKSASQGWNAVYLGRNSDGSYRFWSTNVGTVDLTFRAGSWIPQGAFEGYYLGAVNVSPNTTRLQNWDSSRSV